jgi:beta-glucosidase
MDVFIDNLMAKMTLTEKVGQLNLLAVPSFVSGNASDDNDSREQLIADGKLGAMYGSYVAEDLLAAQKLAVEKSRLGIPLIFGYDVIHGLQTVQPIPLALSTSWNPELIERGARAASLEATASGINWVYSPMLDICRDARWGRIAETFGEDPYLCGELGKAMVRGYQGTDLADSTTVMACVKHYALYGAVESGRDYNIVNMGRQEALNGFLPPYRECAYEGTGSFMASFNDFEGIPAHVNRYLLNDLLREEWGFKGFITSDYEGINECVKHGIGDIEEVTALAIEASVDMDLNGSAYMDNLENLVKQGRLSEKDIEVACRRVLEAKYKLGLFEDPYRYLDMQRYQREIHTDEARQLSREIARECEVLLKNEGSVLPLSKSAKIALVGPFAVAGKEMQGCWSFSKFADGCITFLEGMQEAVAANGGSVTYAEGCWVLEDKQMEQDMVNQYLGAYKQGQVIKPVHTRPNEQLVAEAVAVARRSDVVVAALGELNNMNGEGVSRSDITLGRTQVELLKALKATGKPVVLILTAGRPLALTETEPLADAILYTWSLGDQAGRAVADVVFGDVNPSARLTTSFPRNVGQCPIYYNHKNTGRPHQDGATYSRFNSNYLDCIHGPLYAFGHGLSYTTFEYSDVTLSTNEMIADGQVKASVTVTNTGQRDGKEVVQLYVKDVYATCSRPVMELKGFEKISLKAGESKTVSFEIGRKQLEYYNHALQLTVEPGDFEIMIGHDSQHVNKAKLTVN